MTKRQRRGSSAASGAQGGADGQQGHGPPPELPGSTFSDVVQIPGIASVIYGALSSESRQALRQACKEARMAVDSQVRSTAARWLACLLFSAVLSC